MENVECLVRVENELGECPIWDDRTGTLLWVDIKGRRLHRMELQRNLHQSSELPEQVGSFALTARNNLLLAAGQNGFHWLDRNDGSLTPIYNPEVDHPDNRFNDGRCDRQGRFWAGTMCDPRREPLGSLYRLDSNLNCRKKREHITVPNSLAWSPDGRTMYFADTPTRQILAFDYDPEKGEATRERLLVDLSDRAGRPDGSCIDQEGCLWTACYAGGRVIRVTPTGRIVQEITLPAPNPTCCAFGGTDLDVLFVTSARQRMSEAELMTYPLSGGLFAVKTGTRGLPESRFAGLPVV